MISFSLEPHLTPLTKTNSKWIKDINVRAENVQFLHETTWKTLLALGLTTTVFDTTSEAQGIK